MFDTKFDLVIVGGGNAGLCAALTAIENLKNVLLVEKAPPDLRAGNTRHTRNIRYAHDEDAYTTGPYREDEFLDDIRKVTGGETNLALAKLVVSESATLPKWMEAQGIIWKKSLKGTLHLDRTNAFYLGGGKALANAYYRTAARRGVKILYNASVEDILTDENTVRELVVTVNGKKVICKSEAVVVASGGFEANINWLREAWGDAARNFVVRGTKYNDGLVLRKLLDRDAMPIGNPKSAHMIAVDARAPKYDGGIVTRVDSIPFSIVVNKLGKRFYDEGEDIWPRRYAIWGRLIAEQPEQVAYSVFDSKIVGKFIPPAFSPHTANTLKELADHLELDASTLMHTVQEFNSHIVEGGTFKISELDGCKTAGLNPPKSNWANPINTPPYYAFKLLPGITFTYMGVCVNERAQVLSKSGKPFENLYAAGEIMSGNILSKGYLGGFGLTVGHVFGRIAGSGAADND